MGNVKSMFSLTISNSEFEKPSTPPCRQHVRIRWSEILKNTQTEGHPLLQLPILDRNHYTDDAHNYSGQCQPSWFQNSSTFHGFVMLKIRFDQCYDHVPEGDSGADMHSVSGFFSPTRTRTTISFPFWKSGPSDYSTATSEQMNEIFI